MAIGPELMRGCLLEALRRRPRTEYTNLKQATAKIAAERGLAIHSTAGTPASYLDDVQFQAEDSRRYREALWSLIIEGVVAIGMDEHNENWPFLSLTEFGEEYAASGGLTPYDPDGYLKTLANTRALDDTEQRYIPQALQAIRRGLPDAVAVLIGAAAEHLLISLAEEIGERDPKGGAGVRSKLQGHALPLLVEVRLYFDSHRKSLPPKLREGIGTTFAGIADLIRATRNDAGHPRLDPVSREQAFVNLQLFPRYRDWVINAIGTLPCQDEA